jgi:hypothetical protein
MPADPAGHGGCRLAGHRIGQYAHFQQCAPGNPRAHTRRYIVAEWSFITSGCKIVLTEI